MPLSKFESMLKTNRVLFFDASEFEQIIEYYIEIGKYSLANQAIKIGLDQHPFSISLKLLKVELLILEDKLHKAISLLKEIEILEPNNEEIFIQKASIFSKQSNHKKAILILKKALKYSNEPEDILSLIGMEYLYIEDYQNAKEYFKKCIDIDTQDYTSLYNVIYCYDMEKQHDAAINFLDKYINKNPYCEIAWHQLGHQYYVIKEYTEALKAFDFSILIDDTFIGGYLKKAKTLEKLNRFEEAIENYIITLQIDDPTAFTYFRIAKCLEKINDIEKAIIYYNKAINEDPLLVKADICLCNIYYNCKNYKKAIHHIENAIQIDDLNTNLWLKYADINIELNDYKKAKNTLYNIIKIDKEKTNIDIYVKLADTLLSLKEYNQAIDVLLNAKNQSDKTYPEIEYRLFGLLAMNKDINNSLKHLKKGLSINFDYYKTVKPLFKEVFSLESIKNIIKTYKN